MDRPSNNPTLHRADYVSLKEYVDRRIDALCLVIDKSEQVMNARMDGLNEFRSAMSDQASRFVQRDEYRVAHKALEDASQECRDFMAEHRGKASQSSVLYLGAIALAGLIISLIGIFVK
jgi:hypothetical protein